MNNGQQQQGAENRIGVEMEELLEQCMESTMELTKENMFLKAYIKRLEKEAIQSNSQGKPQE